MEKAWENVTQPRSQGLSSPTLDTRLHAAFLDNEKEKDVGMATLIQIPLCFQNGNPMFQTSIKCSTFTAAGCTMHASLYWETTLHGPNTRFLLSILLLTVI